MKKIVLLILIIAFSGCVSKKATIKETTKLDMTEQVEASSKQESKQETKQEAEKQSTTTVKDKTVIRKTETEYSQPDSVGNQHVLKEVKTETLNDIAVINEENERIISEQRNEINSMHIRNSNLQLQLDEKVDNKIVTSTKVPLWSYIIALIVGAVVALIIRQWITGRFRR